ncbi:MAG: hypothetical protein AB8B53_12580, partial [Flavobacteriales bacterium]
MRKTLISTLACLCLFLSFNSLNAQFEAELRLIPSDCEYGMIAFLAGATDYANTTYDWGDGTSQSANWAYVEHTYAEPGLYTVIVVNNFITYVGEISVEDCTCPTALEAIEVYGQCSSVSVTVDTYIYSLSEYNVEWTWGDGNTSSSSWGYPTGYHSYEQEGEYEICGFFTGPGCEDGVLICDSVSIVFCDEPCYYGDPIIEFNENTCSYDVGLIEAPSDVIWTVNGEYYETNSWPTSVELPEGDNTICMEILPNLDWSCPLGYTECFDIYVEEDQCSEPELNYEETSCGLIEFQYDIFNADIELQSVSFGDGVVYDLSNGENFEHYYGPLPNVYQLCITYNEVGSTLLLEDCFQVEVAGCPEQFCWLEVWGQELECGLVDFNAYTELDIYQDYEVFWTFGDGASEYGWSWTQHAYTEPGTYTACAEVFSPFCEGQFLIECFTITIEECEEECTEPVTAASLDCGFWEFTVGENWSVEFAVWDFGDGTEVEVPFNDVISVQHQYEESGVYEVCVNYYDLSCNGMTEECFTITVQTCGDEICNALTYNFTECLQANFTFEGQSDGFYDQWQVSQNGEVLLDYETINGSGTTVSFPGAGLYTVGVTDALNCDGDIEAVFVDVIVEPCPSCPEIYTEYLECLDGMFFFEGDISGGLYCWELWSNGNMISTYFDGSFTQITFPSAGEYQVGVTNALNCDGVQEIYFITVVVEDCSGNSCGCEQNNNLLANGNFEGGTTVNSGLGISCQCEPASVCVGSEPQDKCDNTYWLQNFYDHTYGTPNGNFLIVDGGQGNVWNEEVLVVEGQTYNFSMWIAREISDNTTGNNSTQNLYTEVNGVIHTAFSTAGAQAQAWEEYCFEYTADYTGVAIVGVGQESGTGYNDWGLDDVYFGTCGSSEECPEIIVEALECDYGLFSYAGEIDNTTWSNICWEVYDSNNTLLSTYLDGESTDYNFLEPGTYYVSVTNAVLCNGQIPVIQIEVPECGGDCPEIIVEALECDYGSFSYAGEIDNTTWSSICWEVYDSNNNLLSTYLDGDITDYNFLEPGTYYVSVTNAVPCNDQIPVIQIEVPECSADCPEITINPTECLFGSYTFSGNYTSDAVQWQIIQNGEVLLELWGSETVDISFVEAGEYTITVANALTCEGEELVYSLDVWVEECYEDCSFDLPYSVDCSELTVYMPDFVTWFTVDYGNGIYSELPESITYSEPGWYTVCYNAYIEECQQWVEDCIEVYIEDCDENCEFELSYYSDCDELTIVMPDIVSEYYIDYGNGIYGEVSETIVYDEPGNYTVCYEAYVEQCDEWVADCIEIYIEDCDEEECVPMTLSLDADYGEIDNVTELISAAIMGEEGEAVWEGLLPLSTFITSIDVELCIPPGCYTFQIMNEDPLLLVSLSLGLESAETEDIQISSELDILSGSLETLIAVQSDCIVSVGEIVEAELT